MRLCRSTAVAARLEGSVRNCAGQRTSRCSAFASLSYNPGVDRSARRVLILLSIAELLAMSLWFTGTAVLPQLSLLWGSGIAVTSWLTIAVQLGFVIGALVISIFNVSDIFHPTRVFVVCALLAAADNAAFVYVAERQAIGAAIFLRML